MKYALAILACAGIYILKHIDSRRCLLSVCTCLLILIISLPRVGYAIECKIGSVDLSIPNPQDFSNASEISKDYFLMFKDQMYNSNRLLAVFFTNEDAGRLIRGDYAELDRMMSVLTPIKLEDTTITIHQFGELRARLRKKYDSDFQKQSQLIDDAAKKAGFRLSKSAEIDIAIQANGSYVSLIDYETESSIAMSYLKKSNIPVKGKWTEHISAVTNVVLLVKGKVVYLMVHRIYKTDSDITWTRSTAQDWKAQVLTANETDFNSIMSIIFGENWFLSLLISAILTWGIGLAPPLITRFAILGHPLTKPGAIIFVVIFLLINIVVFTALESTSKTHGALLLVAWASFAILRKGSRQYDEQRKKAKTEKETIQEDRQQHEEEKQQWERERAEWEQKARVAEEEAQRAQEEARRQAEEARRRAEEEKWSQTHVRKDEQYYARVLGLSGKMTKGDLRKRYRDLASKYHPDRVNHLGDKLKETAEREMKEINEAFDYFKKKYGI